MDCMQIKDKLVQYIEGLLTKEEKTLIDNHLTECNDCNKELSVMMEIQERLVFASRQNRSADLENRVFDQIIREQNRILKKTFKPNQWLGKWRSIMKSRTTRLSAATAVVFALIIGVTIFFEYEPVATAQEILSDAVKAASGLDSIHMKGRMRTPPAGVLDTISLKADFLPIEMWKRVNREGVLQWRVEKSGGTFVLTDGEGTIMFSIPKAVNELPLGYGSDSWMWRLMNMEGLLESELTRAKDNPDRIARLIREKVEGRDKIILEVDVRKNKADDDYLKNKLISKADSLREYRFDAETKLLEGFKIYVIDDGNEILVFELTDIDYNAKIDDSVFVPDLPDDVTWFSERRDLSYDEKYSRMTPGEIAAAFFNACTKGEWDELLKLVPMDEVSQGFKERFIGLELISIGETKKSEVYEGFNVWFVPYEIRFNNGEINKHTLEMIYNEKAGRYLVEAGF